MFAAVAIVAAASCQKEINEPINNGGDFTVTASIGADTKTVLEDGADGNKIYWTPGDKIAVYNAEGQEVTFITDITEKSTTATFTNDSEFTVPSSLVAVSPKRTDRGATSFADGIVTGLHIGGTQNAVAGSYDPLFAVAIGTPKSEGSNELIFNNVHSLIKFTIGGTIAPKSIRLKNNGQRAIAGMYDYNIVEKTSTMTGGDPYIDLTGTFEVGQTYYIATTAGLCGGGISLIFDGETVKNTGENITLEHNKIYNLGTVQLPEEEPEPEPANFTATAVMSKQSEGSTSYMTTFGGTANADRNIGMDDEYVYIAETQANPVLWKISIADGTASKMPVGTVNGGGTFALACPRIIPNTDPTINNGEDVLTVSNMGMEGGNTFLYVYNNGIKADPTKLNLNTAWMSRRIGDKFTYMTGTNGLTTLWMKDGNSGALLSFNLTMKDGAVSCTEATTRTYLLENWVAGVGAIYFYPGATSSVEGMYTSTEKGTYVVRTDNVLTADNKPTYVAQWEDLTTFKGCHGFNFFKVGDRNYIAYTKYSDQTLYIINGTANAAGVKAALEANDVVWSAKIAADGNGCYSGNSGADCAVRTLDDGSVLVAGHIQNVGVVVFKLTLNN